ncbi:hypothetical protein [Asaia lannensis]|uniref:hypothetical protein n=1 Tax=Asaia lannensis TaxID=415421 RepID=UPI001C999E83
MTSALLSLPLWMQFLTGFILLGLGLMFMLMPFSIFGVKPRLEEVELQLNEVRAELRIIAMRLAQGAGETGPSGEPIYAPPRRASQTSVEATVRPVEPVRSAEPMPWSAQTARQTTARAVPLEETPRHDPSSRPSAGTREPVVEERRERPVSPPPARDDYSYAESGAQENIERILRPTHFEPPPSREAPRPPMPPSGNPSASPVAQQASRQSNDEAWRLRDHRQEMAPRGAGAEAEKLRNAEEAGARRMRSEPTLRWPPRP